MIPWIKTGGEVEHQDIQVGCKTIHYSVTGAGHPLILLHGLSGSMHWWSPNVAYLAEHFKVYLVDLIGFGRSRGQQFSLPEASGLVYQWMNRLGIETASIIGHSMGGFIGLDLAVQYSDRISHLVLVSALSLPIKQSLARKGWELFQSVQKMPINFLPVLLYDALRAGPLTLFSAIQQVYTADFRDRLAQVSTPRLVVWGEEDLLLPLEYGWQLARALPGSEFQVIHRAGHNPMWEQPEVFNQIVSNFLRQDPISISPVRYASSHHSLRSYGYPFV